MIPKSPSISLTGGRSSRFACLAATWCFSFCFLGGALAHGQILTAPAATQDAEDPTGYGSSASADSSLSSGIGINASSGFNNLAPRESLSAEQITGILQQNPDLVLELKSQLSDRMQQQGVQIDPSEISDQIALQPDRDKR